MNKEKTKAEIAAEYFANGFLCSQAVFAAFAPQLGMSEKQALMTGACFGSGMCRGEVCGAVSGGLMALGLKFGQCEPEDKQARVRTNALTGAMLEEFTRENGSYLCARLLDCDFSSPEDLARVRREGLFTSLCPRLVESAARITERLLAREDSSEH